METTTSTSAQTIDIGVIHHLIKMLEDNRKLEQLESMVGVFDAITTIETNLNAAMAELHDVKTRLNLEHPSAMEEVQKMESGLQRLKNQLNGMKQKFVDTAQHIVQAVKEKGISALDKTSEFVSLKENLTALSEGINGNILSIEKGINTINSMTQELNAVVKHTKNISKAMTGKERDGTMAQASETMVKPLQAVKKMLIAMDNKSVHAVSRVDALSQRANRGKSQEGKPSVLQGLKDGKANTKEPTAPKPKSKEMEL